jgi:alpha-L-fucosidase
MRHLAGRVDYAQFLHDGSEILFTEKNSNHFSVGRLEADDLVVFNIPQIKPQMISPVIEVFLK